MSASDNSSLPALRINGESICPAVLVALAKGVLLEVKNSPGKSGIKRGQQWQLAYRAPLVKVSVWTL